MRGKQAQVNARHHETQAAVPLPHNAARTGNKQSTQTKTLRQSQPSGAWRHRTGALHRTEWIPIPPPEAHVILPRVKAW